MSSIINSMYNLRQMEDLARMETALHRVHPLAKLLTTIAYLVVVVSFDRYEVTALLPLVFYPVLVLVLADIPAWPIIKKVLLVQPLIIGIGILNPWFDHQVIEVGGMLLSKGWLTFISILLKGSLTVAAAFLLIATTGMDGVARALRMLRAPRLFVLQLLLTYRYISVLMEEVARTLRAYSLRSPKGNGIQRPAWGPLVGQLILRTFDRAERVYQAMCLRGFTGEYRTGRQRGLDLSDTAYTAVWVVFFILARVYNIPVLIGLLLTGGLR
ncbi:MAG: cobalt ECF transporter T component CbiQ [Firmicutes bacterium]|nr:cobalt ECF transporter T component CbiQ [Bacillota bacterium]